MFINFSEIPNSSNLFLDYLYEFDNVKKYYGADFRNRQKYPLLFQEISSQRKNQNKNSEAIYEIVKKQYKDKTPSAKTQRNIELLKSSDSLTIVTGQQLGLLGGPLYTFYKTITVLKLVSSLSQDFDNYNFIPVFWMESEDHDLLEVNNLSILDEQNLPKELILPFSSQDSENHKSVGNIEFTDNITSILNELQTSLRNTDFSKNIFSLLNSIYTKGKTYKNAFKELMFSLFDKYGLVIFDPKDDDVKNLLKPIFKNELTNYRKHSESLVNISAQLDEVYHSQVKIRAINLFMEHENERFLIEPIEDGFRLKNKRIRFSKEEIFNLLETQPNLFSPNVLLRPVCQDFLFPTAFYVAGPGEIAYFAQALHLYDYFNISKPIIYPRISATILEKNIQNIINKLNISNKDVFIKKDSLTELIVKNISNFDLNSVFGMTQTDIELSMNHLKDKTLEIDVQIGELLEKYKSKMIVNLEEYKTKVMEAQKRKHEISLRQFQKVLNSILPNQVLQERVINYYYFANKYGDDFLSLLFDSLLINKFEHQIVQL